MNLSLNEIEVMCKRAARGAGLPWGLAEEAAAASRFLTEVALPGADMLARLLERNDRRPVAMLAPMAAEGCWRAVSGRLCPVIAGSVLSDRAAELETGAVFEMEEVDLPLLLLPFAAASIVGRGARFFMVALLIAWGGPKFEEKLRQYVDVIGWAVVVLIVVAYLLLRG